jgi:hypothetical protein
VRTEPRGRKVNPITGVTTQPSEKKKWRYACRLFEMNIFKKGAMCRIDLLLENNREINNETTAVVRQRPMCQWTGWKAVFSAESAPIAAHATMGTTMRSSIFYAFRAEGL